MLTIDTDPLIDGISPRSILRAVVNKRRVETVLIVHSRAHVFVCGTIAGQPGRVDIAQLGSVAGAIAAAEDLFGPLDWTPGTGYIAHQAPGPAAAR